MWQAAIGALVGYLFGLWWVRRDARKEVNATREMFAARLESRDQEIISLRENFDKSQRAVAAYERRARYLESAVAANLDQKATRRALGDQSPPSVPVTPAR
ncbi:MAG: hypothetical protein OER12_01415 [Acidimicrobiia bacterium]|nr:hypothetical protein [Acidimicrobiia bacterium]